MKLFNTETMKLSSFFTAFQDHDSQFMLKVAFGTNVIGLIGGWLAQNWYVLGGFVVASVVPVIMSWRKHSEELRHTRIMNQIEEEKAKNSLL